MRYMNWDVLIFPETGDSKTPLQEFTTSCTVIQDPALDNTTGPVLGNSVYLKTVTHPLPTVSCFVPSLLPGSPVRVSLHSWATPVASRATQAMAAQGNPVWFEAKVLLDGICTAGTLFSQDSSWPQIIDKSHSMDKDNKHEQIRFPPFHQELLTQIWANPAQGMGTVRVVIAEGINQEQAGSPSFARLRNIVTFSFQHAPLHILENCGIAWPNPGMWWQAQQQFPNLTSPRTEPADPDAHAHSPRRQQASKGISGPRAETAMAPPHMSQGLVAHPAFRAHGSHGNDPFWSQHGPMHDPFTGAATFNSFYKTMASRYITDSGVLTIPDHSRSTSTSHDESMPDYSRPPSPGSSLRSYPMPDYSRPLSPASSRRSYPMPDYSRPPTLPGSRQPSELTNPAMNECSVSRLEYMLQSHQEHHTESQFDDMIALLSPRKNSNTSGISAPSNTRVNSAVNTPKLHPSGMSAAAQDRALSYSGHPRSVSVTTRDPPPPAIQASRNGAKSSSNFTIVLSPSVDGNIADTKPQPETIVKKKPVGRPKGRKEGKTTETGSLDAPIDKTQRRATKGTAGGQGKENEANSPEKFGDGKRRRVTNNNGFKIPLEDRLANRDGSSPMRKTSKTGPKNSPSKGFDELTNITGEGMVTRSPLGELENCL